MTIKITLRHWVGWLLMLLCAGTHAGSFEDTMRQRTLACTVCHGEQGRAGPDGYYPRIAGKPAGYLYNQLINLREGRRHYTLMQDLIEPLSDAYLHEIAQYFASLELPYLAPTPREATAAQFARGRTLVLHGDPERRLPACARCHGDKLTGVLPSTPGLLGLPRDYLNAQLGGWRTGQRRAKSPDCMSKIASRLDAQDVGAITVWLSSQALPANPAPALHAPAAVAGDEEIVCGSAP
jgi:cytochrome c553